MNTANKSLNITEKFLQNILGNEKRLIGFEVSPGSNVGDGFLSIILSISGTVELKTKTTKKIHLLFKCFPSSEACQEILKSNNIFWKEKDFYETIVPAFSALATHSSATGSFGNILPFPPFVGGNVIDFDNVTEMNDKSTYNKIYAPLENYLVMIDMKNEFGYKLANRKEMLDFEHMKLTIKALAKFHAYSWGYKCIKNVGTFTEKFRSIDLKIAEEQRQTWKAIFVGGFEHCSKVLAAKLSKDSPLAIGTQKLIGLVDTIVDIAYPSDGVIRGTLELLKCHRLVNDIVNGNNDPWSSAIHGDCWTNNVLFRYDEQNTKIPVDAILIDLQFLSEQCPLIDLALLIYTSSTTELRKKHLKDILRLYHDQFVHHCKELNIDCLPGFSLQEIERRFHASKVFGYAQAAAFLPVILRNAEFIKNPESSEEKQISDYWTSLLKVDNTEDDVDSLFETRLVQLADELYNEGVI